VLVIRIHNQQYFYGVFTRDQERNGFPEHIAFVDFQPEKTTMGKQQVLH